MARNFLITYYRYEDSIHLKLYGDFDGSSAHELLNHLKVRSHDTLKIYIHTDGLTHFHPFGLNTFFKSFRIQFETSFQSGFGEALRDSQ